MAAIRGAPGASVQDAKEVYVIRRGDTLWAIAKRHLGSGLRYTSIFQDNREKINNPEPDSSATRGDLAQALTRLARARTAPI